MDVGIALPTMARGFSRQTFLAWCHGVDAGPFSSISTGDRLTFHNPELFTATAAAAALTERVRVMTNLVVLPMHATAVVAKQLATLDVLSAGRLTVGVGVGGREADYRAAGVSMQARHRRLDDGVRELRRLWAGEPAFPGADPVGPSPVQLGGPPLLAGALGPKATRRAAEWADGITGFTISARHDEMARTNTLAVRAWGEAGRTTPPRLVNGTFYVLGGDTPVERLRAFAFEYLQVFGDDVARALAQSLDVTTPERIRAVLHDAADAGCDEFVLVPGTVDPGCLEATLAAVAAVAG